MDKPFTQFYERELRYIRELASEFGRAFPKVAARLGITDQGSDDPHVERLLQGHAFLAAGVHQRLDAAFPAVSHALLEQVTPGTLGPTPSVAIVEFQPDAKQGSLSSGYEIERGSTLRARDHSGSRVCEFRTAHPVRLWPIVIESAHYTTVLRDFTDLRIPTREPVQALLKLRLRTQGGRPFASLGLADLPIHLHGADELSGRLYEALVAHTDTLVLRHNAGGRLNASRSTATAPVRALGFADEYSLLPTGPALLRGYRLLQEYFALPSRFHFVELAGLGQAVASCDADSLELIVALNQFDPTLEGDLPVERFKLYTTPVINLFPRVCDAVTVAASDVRVRIVPEQARPGDHEVHTVQRVVQVASGSGHEGGVHGHEGGDRGDYELAPFHAVDAQDGALMDRPRYLVERAGRRQSAEELRRAGVRAPYLYQGDDVFIRLAALSGASAIRLQVHALCTNRDLPMQLALGKGATDFTMPSGAPLRAIRCVTGPTVPRASQLDGAAAWDMISHWSQTSLALRDPQTGGEALRELLRLFAQRGDPLLLRELDSVRSVASSSVIRPRPAPGPWQFVRGLEITLTCDEQGFGAHRAFTLAAVLSQLFARHAPELSFAETVLKTPGRGEIHRWPPVAGLRPVM